MSPLGFTGVTFLVSMFAGGFGSLLGLGGGLIVVPVLTLALGVDIKHAIAASIVSVIATSSGAAAAYVRERMTNLRVAMFLELGTTLGAMTGAFLVGILEPRLLFVLFGLMLGATAIAMFRKRHGSRRPPAPDAVADRLRLHGSYPDAALGREVPYRVTASLPSLALMYVAGVLSALLGIGSGVLKVPAMDLAMHLPLKVSTATSNFMIGVTAAASAGVYYLRGDIEPMVAGPVAAGIVIGATAGARLLPRLENRTLRILFVTVLLIVAAQMVFKGVRG